MPEITPSLINDLHGRTGQPVLECKKALVEADGHLGKAIDWFRQRGVFPVLRTAAEGRVAVMNCDDGRCGALVEINCNSDAVAHSGPVAKLAAMAARLLLRHPDADITQAANTNLNIDDVSHQTGEKIRIGRSAFLRNKDGRVGTYNDQEGRIGVLLSITGKISEEMLKDLCLHVARHDPPPAALTRDRMPQDLAASPDAGARALLDQKFIKDPTKTIAQLIQDCNCSLVEFVRVEVGT
jgi:elongation factor Ts